MTDKPLPFFNWSIRRLLATETDSFQKAKLRILFTILALSILKILIAMPVIFERHQAIQQGRAIFSLVLYIVLMKLMLWKKELQRLLTHTMLCLGIAFIWSIQFVTAQSITLVNVQFVFMAILSAFYLLDRRYGLIYGSMAVLPLILFLIAGNSVLPRALPPDTLSSPVMEILIVLNFLTIMLAHYLYHEAFSRNVKEKEILNARLAIAVQEANSAAQSKSNFLSTMSHELRTPLNSVIGMSELLLDHPHDEEQGENLNILHFSALSLHSLVNDILDFSKMDSGNVKLEYISVDLYALIKNVCSGFRQAAKEKGLKLTLEVDDSLKNIQVNTDPMRVTQVIYNLVGNAIKFTPAGGVIIRLNETARGEGTVSILFAVIDTGIGIENHEAIFEPFVQASSSTTRKFGGTGLGLAIVKHLLVLFNSRIRLDSESGKGAAFSFEIVFSISEQPVNTYVPGAAQAHDLSALRVLIAEDNAVNRLLMRKVFAKWNNTPMLAEDGRQVLDRLQEADYDVVLMDIHMPLLDGYAAARAIRAMSDPVKAAVPVIALTASVSDNLGEKIRAAGMNDYIAKPFSSRELYAKLQQLTATSS